MFYCYVFGETPIPGNEKNEINFIDINLVLITVKKMVLAIKDFKEVPNI